MKYMLMMHAPRGTGDWGIADWPPERLQAHIDFMLNLNKELVAEGVLAGAEGLATPGEARIVRGVGTDGAPVVTDGPYPESKEFLAGYWIVDVESPEQAYRIAGRATVAPGKDGRPMNIPIEIRQRQHRIQQRQGDCGADSAKHGPARNGFLGDDHDPALLI